MINDVSDSKKSQLGRLYASCCQSSNSIHVCPKGYEEVYKGAPPAAKGHNLFTSDDAIIDEVLKRFEKLLKKENL